VASNTRQALGLSRHQHAFHLLRKSDDGRLTLRSSSAGPYMTGTMESGVDRTVIVSGYTTTLDVIAKACYAAGMKKLSRLDGSVPPAQRNQLVTSFNAGHGRGLRDAARHVMQILLAASWDVNEPVHCLYF